MGTHQEKFIRKNKEWSLPVKPFFLLILKTVLIIICFAVYLLITPIFFAFMTPLYLYRFLVILLQKICHPDWVGIMSTRDAIVGLDKISTHCQCMITVQLILQGEANLSRVREVFQKEVLEGKDKYGKLSYLKLTYFFENWFGFTFWKREDFVLENHIREFGISELETNNEYVTEDQLMEALGKAATKPFPYGRSPWEVLVVKRYRRKSPQIHVKRNNLKESSMESVDSGVESVVVLRMHHAIGDGYSILKLIMSNLCGNPLSVVPTAPVHSVSSLTEMLKYIAVVVLTPYYHFLQFFYNVDRTIWHLPANKLSKEWQFAITERLSFEDIKVTSKNMGVCVTATLLAGLGGGIHNFLRAKGQEKRNSRVMRGLSPMPWKNHPMDTLVNHWSVGVFDIPVHESCPRKRLVAANESVAYLKSSPILLTNFVTVPILLGAPNWLTDFWGTNWMTTMIISNFPGPSFPCHAFYKSQCINDVVSWVPHMRGSAGLGAMFLSYNGGVRVSLSVDKSIIKDRNELDSLSNYISQEFMNLRSLQPATEDIV